MVSTNIDFATFYEGKLEELECVKSMYKVLAMFADYAKESYFRDKVTAIVSIYTGEVIM